jgi:hypothetical protein
VVDLVIGQSAVAGRAVRRRGYACLIQRIKANTDAMARTTQLAREGLLKITEQ